MKKVGCVLLIVFGVIVRLLVIYVIFAVFIIFGFSDWGLDEQHDWFTQTNAEQTMQINVKKTDAFTFGSQKIFVYVNDDLLIETEIYNDGGALYDHNYLLTWYKGDALLSFFGTEQATETYRIHLDNGEASYKVLRDKRDR
jgi:hypothetical protein